MSDFDYSTLWEQPLFAVLSPIQRQWLVERISFEQFPSRTTIYSSSDLSEHLYFIQEGKVKVETISPTGSRLIKRIAMAHDLFGFKGLFEHETHLEQVTTLRTSATVIKLPHYDLRRLAEANFVFAEKLMGTLWEELIFLEERTNNFTGLSAKERFANFLVEMTRREGRYNGEVWEFNSQLTQAEIGAYIGTGRQTVTEILNEFREEGIVKYNWGRFSVSDLDKLV